jgi:hypothetical protein
MKVTNITTGATSTTKTQAKKAGGNFAAYLGATNEVEAAETAQASGVGGINSLFMLQEIEDEGYSRKKATKRAGDMLDYLDEIRLGLLEGSLSPELLNRLTDLVKQWRENVNDPKLESIIDEIELRAAVELAKINSI